MNHQIDRVEEFSRLQLFFPNFEGILINEATSTSSDFHSAIVAMESSEWGWHPRSYSFLAFAPFLAVVMNNNPKHIATLESQRNVVSRFQYLSWGEFSGTLSISSESGGGGSFYFIKVS